MATLRRRLYRKNDTGTYDTVHMETEASLVYMSNGNTVENQLTSHVHDDRYYTEAESNNLLNGKANAYHTHTMDQVTSLVDEINYLKTSVSNGKSAVASAITDKGISTSATADFNTMANNIRALSTTQVAGDIFYLYATQNGDFYIPPLGANTKYFIMFNTRQWNEYNMNGRNGYIYNFATNYEINFVDRELTGDPINSSKRDKLLNIGYTHMRITSYYYENAQILCIKITY